MFLNWLGWESWFPLTLWSQLWDHGAMYLVKSNVRIAEVSWHGSKLSQLQIVSNLIPLYRKSAEWCRMSVVKRYLCAPVACSSTLQPTLLPEWRNDPGDGQKRASAWFQVHSRDFGFVQEPPSRKSRWSGSQPLKLWSWGSLSSKAQQSSGPDTGPNTSQSLAIH